MLLRGLTFFLYLIMLSSGRNSFRCVSAFASSIHVSFGNSKQVMNNPSSSSWGRVVSSSSSSPSLFSAIQNARGGSDSKRFLSSPAAASSSIDQSSSDQSSDDNKKQHQIAQDSIGMLGSSVQHAKFGGSIDYLDTSKMKEFRVLFVLGGPGAGKGTQSAFLEEQYTCVHLSVGELLRQEQTKEDSPNGALIKEYLKEGKIVPVEISLSLLQQAMEDAAAEKGKSIVFLVDGFPRNYDNLEGWVRCMSSEDNSVASAWGVLVYTCPLEELERRILERAETSGRSDDNLKSAQKRFATFEQQTMPVVETLKIVQQLQEEADKPALKVEEITGDKPIEEVWRDTQTVMKRFVANDVLTANAQLLESIEKDDVDQYVELCGEDLLEEKMEEIMEMYEGEMGKKVEISNPKIEFVTGTKAIVSYDRTTPDGEQTIRESRVWSHQGTRGWVNVHFSRTPLLP